VLDRYVHALGGDLHLVADFGDEQIKIGKPTASRGITCGAK
jgi:hypothetical protein